MKNFFRFIFTLLLGIVIGHYVSYSSALEGTWAGDTLNEISAWLPAPNNDVESYEESAVVDEKSTTESISTSLDNIFVTDEDNGSEVNLGLVEESIFNQLNALRKDQGLESLVLNETLQAAARQRSVESSESFSHTRPDGTTTFTILEEPEYFYPYSLAGENLGMATYIKDEEHMAEVMFQGWVDSPDHYEAMINPEFHEVGIGAYLDSGILYATQYFGTPVYEAY